MVVNEAKNYCMECERAECLQEKITNYGYFIIMESGYCLPGRN
jgi:hypothetical protein